MVVITHQARMLFSPGKSGTIWVLRDEVRHSCPMAGTGQGGWQREPQGSSRVSGHGLLEWFGLEGTFRDHLVQLLCREQGHLPLDHVAQSPIHPDLDRFQ